MKCFSFGFYPLGCREPKSLHPCGGCDDGPCSIAEFTGSPLSRRLTPEEPAAGPPQDSNPGPSSLDYLSGLDTQPGEVKSYLQLKTFVFIGTHYRTDLGLMFPPVVRFRETAKHAHRILLGKYATARDFLSLLRRLVSMSDLVPLGRLAYQPHQLYTLACWRPSQGQPTDRIPLDHPFLDPFLKWWTKPTNVLQGRPIQCPPPQLAI